MAGMIIFVIVVITILYFITKGMGSKNSENLNSSLDNLSKEEKRNKYINQTNVLIEMYGISETTALQEECFLEERGIDIDIAKEVLFELYDIKYKNKEREIDKKIEYVSSDIENCQEKGEIEKVNKYKEILLHFQELKREYEENKKMKEQEKIRSSNEIEHNIENNCFIETNIPLIAEEGCFDIFDNIEHYEYRTRYGATNYEKIGEGKLYITNKRLYLITDISSYHLIWLNNIMDVNWYFLEDENKFQLKITRDGNAIFLESYDEVDIFKMYYYIKTIMKNK
ncbi:hypothetical protein [Brachyspira aalborgi]|uniref:Uncharacterized protein n=1 Tax=Brachyspira aalborgi TaxID=29522 RepID=A0A5C8G0U5_9SPIR|nr:hypothetical protein [Brachyspira aalborgi]TXJ55580.1 hypothetical protein EPJ76_08340 [Brachyspira aalborgi]